MAGNRFNGPLRDIGALWSPIAAIGVDRDGIGDNHL